MKRGWRFWLEPYHFLPVVGYGLLIVWYTVLCAGFAYVYWFTGFHDFRNVFPTLLSDLGAIMVFPVGWLGLLYGLYSD